MPYGGYWSRGHGKLLLVTVAGRSARRGDGPGGAGARRRALPARVWRTAARCGLSVWRHLHRESVVGRPEGAQPPNTPGGNTTRGETAHGETHPPTTRLTSRIVVVSGRQQSRGSNSQRGEAALISEGGALFLCFGEYCGGGDAGPSGADTFVSTRKGRAGPIPDTGGGPGGVNPLTRILIRLSFIYMYMYMYMHGYGWWMDRSSHACEHGALCDRFFKLYCVPE